MDGVARCRGGAQNYFYCGNDNAPDLPTFYGVFFADGRPKKIALAFCLWSEFSHYPQRRAVAFAPEIRGLWALAGQNAQGNVAILIANSTETATIGQLAFEDGRSLADYTGAVHTVSNAHPPTLSAPFTATPVIIAPYSVLLITLTQP